jgi:hypothetical protein
MRPHPAIKNYFVLPGAVIGAYRDLTRLKVVRMTNDKFPLLRPVGDGMPGSLSNGFSPLDGQKGAHA